jgi:hypothetical protein
MMGSRESAAGFSILGRSISLWVYSKAATFMRVFREENATAQPFRESRQQGNALTGYLAVTASSS